MANDYSDIAPIQTAQRAKNSCSPSPCSHLGGQTFGEFLADLPESQEYLLLVFSPSSLPLKKRWRSNGLSADFLADYLSIFFPGNEDDAEDENDLDSVNRSEQIQSTVSYIANELLENAMKFSDHTAPTSIRIELQLYQNRLIFLVTNSVRPEVMQNYQTFIQEALASDPGEMMMHRLEKIAGDDTLQSSGLGLVTMMNDYSAKLGWKFEPVPEAADLVMVTTMVQVDV